MKNFNKSNEFQKLYFYQRKKHILCEVDEKLLYVNPTDAENTMHLRVNF